MKTGTVPRDDAEVLVAELHRLGLRHLVRFGTLAPAQAMPSEQLLVGLASHPQARLRAALILLFLRRSELSLVVRQALAGLAFPATVTLKLYYQAAVYLQVEHEPRLRRHIAGWQPLPDLFSAELGLPRAGTASTEAALGALGEVHRRLSGWDYNWAGSYQQHVGLFLRQMEPVVPGAACGCPDTCTQKPVPFQPSRAAGG